jgi:hypothetical protein
MKGEEVGNAVMSMREKVANNVGMKSDAQFGESEGNVDQDEAVNYKYDYEIYLTAQ